LVVSAFSVAANSSPFVVSDSTSFTPAPTKCGWTLDATAKVPIPVALDSTGKPYCKYDLAAVSNGAHTISATFQVDDPIHGLLESAPSSVLNFQIPQDPPVPIGLRVIK
jgi:hypothetical protein